MSIQFNSKAVVVAVICTALNVGVTAVKANTFQSTLSDHLSSGAILLAEDDSGDLLTGTDSSDDSTTAGNSGDTDKSATHSADDIDVNDVGTPRAGATAATNDEEGDKGQTAATDDKPKDESKDASAAAEGDKSEAAATVENKPKDENKAPTQAEMEAAFDLGEQGKMNAQIDPSTGAGAIQQEMVADSKAVIDKMVSDFQHNHPGATNEQLKDYITKVGEAVNQYHDAYSKRMDHEIPNVGKLWVDDTDKRSWGYQYDYFKDRTDEVSQAAKEQILSKYNLTGSQVPEGRDDALKAFHELKEEREKYFKERGK